MLGFEDREALISIITDVLDSGQLIMGPNLESFEIEIASYFGVEHLAVGVANATDAIELLLRALSLDSSDEVVIPAFAPVPVISGVLMAGAKPILVDVDISNATMSPSSLASRVTSNTKVIMPVHLYGNSADMVAISRIAEEIGAIVVEDISQAFGCMDAQGRVLGSIGVASVLSMYPTKNLAAVGDAGALISHSKEIVERVQSLRQYGWDKNRTSYLIGRNSRMDEIQAAVLRARLKSFAEFVTRRNAQYRLISAWVTKNDLGRIVTASSPNTLPHLFVIEPSSKDKVYDALADFQLTPGFHYPLAIHQHPAFEKYGVNVDLQNSEYLASSVMTVPWDLSDQLE